MPEYCQGQRYEAKQQNHRNAMGQKQRIESEIQYSENYQCWHLQQLKPALPIFPIKYSFH